MHYAVPCCFRVGSGDVTHDLGFPLKVKVDEHLYTNYRIIKNPFHIFYESQFSTENLYPSVKK